MGYPSNDVHRNALLMSIGGMIVTFEFFTRHLEFAVGELDHNAMVRVVKLAHGTIANLIEMKNELEKA